MLRLTSDRARSPSPQDDAILSLAVKSRELIQTTADTASSNTSGVAHPAASPLHLAINMRVGLLRPSGNLSGPCASPDRRRRARRHSAGHRALAHPPSCSHRGRYDQIRRQIIDQAASARPPRKPPAAPPASIHACPKHRRRLCGGSAPPRKPRGRNTSRLYNQVMDSVIRSYERSIRSGLVPAPLPRPPRSGLDRRHGK